MPAGVPNAKPAALLGVALAVAVGADRLTPAYMALATAEPFAAASGALKLTLAGAPMATPAAPPNAMAVGALIVI